MMEGLPVTIHWNKRYSNPKTKTLPEGYERIMGTLPKGLSRVATHILNKGNPLGTLTPFMLNGKSYIALNEYHTHYAGRPHEPARQIYAITVFQKR